MKSLYESILDTEDDILKSVDKKGAIFLKAKEILQKMKPMLDGIFQAKWSTEVPMQTFLEDNKLRLVKDDVKKIVNKLKKKLPPDAKFGSKYGIRRLADQNVEDYGTTFSDPRFGYYNISIDYVTGRSLDTLTEHILELHETAIYALDIPETKSIIDVLDEHFEDYIVTEKIKISSWGVLKSEIGGKYRIYDFRHIKKELL